MKVGLLNWSGHQNLGDDAMAEVLQRYLPEAVNMGETPQPADWHILGGGTLISPLSLFFSKLHNPEKTIGISLGVSCNWKGEHSDILMRMKKIYTRDYFSHEVLKKYGVENTLSFDLLCEIGANKNKNKEGIFANFLHQFPHLKWVINKYFALSPIEDKQAMPDAKVYTSAILLREDLATAERIFATRLHANIIAWLSGCKNIYSIPYDMKVIHFWDRVKGIKVEEAQKVIKEHIKEICQIVSN